MLAGAAGPEGIAVGVDVGSGTWEKTSCPELRLGPVGVGPYDVLGDATTLPKGTKPRWAIILVVAGVRGVGTVATHDPDVGPQER